MCYFTDKDYVKKLKGILNAADRALMAKAIFHRALKLQIGCGTEPTLYKELPALVALGKAYKIPYISLTTNANLLSHSAIKDLLDAGLNEFTISLHGVRQNTYESFMQGADYNTFLDVFKAFGELKKQYNFKVRVNYTFNKHNFDELSEFFEVFDPKTIDVLQLRPIKKLGNTAYSDFDLSTVAPKYAMMRQSMLSICKSNQIIFMAPRQIEDFAEASNSKAALVHDYTFCYASPDFLFRPDFNWKTETFERYTRRIRWSDAIFKNIFRSANKIKSVSYKLNYELS